MATRDNPRLGQGRVSGSKKSKGLAKPLGQGLGGQGLGPWANTDGDPKLSDFQNQKQLEGQVLSLCAGFFREIEALLKNTDPSVVARCCPVNVLQMLSNVKRRSDILLEEHLNLMHSLPPAVPTISRLNGERGSKRRRHTGRGRHRIIPL
ncbi:hypothetical protein B0H14DRAFT_2593945 [Mycena olivaceomarginata]|nr:hypothetical protein B0H14DRAFT_2593945 [Mycena olivaceomarginata]